MSWTGGDLRNNHTARGVMIILFFLTFFGARGHAKGTPVSIAPRPILDIFFLPSGQGWLVASDGPEEYLFKTDDGGEHWSKHLLNFPIANIFFLDNNRGWGIAIEAEKFMLVATSDGGVNWKKICAIPQVSSASTILSSLLFGDSEKGWILGSKSKGLSIVLEADAAAASVKKLPALSGIEGLGTGIFRDQRSGQLWIVGNDSILLSSDSGAAWKSIVNLGNLPGKRKAISFTAGQAVGDGKVFVVGESAGGVIFRTEDGGLHWDLANESEETHGFRDIQFWDENHGCTVGSSTYLVCTSDGGNTWKARKVLPKSNEDMLFMDNIFTRIVFLDNGKRGWALASGGFLFQSDDSGNTWHQLDLFAATTAD